MCDILSQSGRSNETPDPQFTAGGVAHDERRHACGATPPDETAKSALARLSLPSNFRPGRDR